MGDQDRRRDLRRTLDQEIADMLGVKGLWEHPSDAHRPGTTRDFASRAKYRVRSGGLMRCCLSALDELQATSAETPKEGDKVRCICCSHSMLYRDGAWEWAGGPRA
jgi:hypothetical protein